MSSYLKMIRNAWIVAVASSVITIAAALYSIFAKSIAGIDSYNLIDAGIGLTLAYGIYRKSRVCASLMLAYFITAKVYFYLETGHIPGALSFLVCLFLVQGVIGTFKYHKAVHDSPRTAA